MSFSAEWLALREPVDHRSRDAGLTAALVRYFAGGRHLRIVDIGCGTGSNFRALSPLLPDAHWTLVDYDQCLLEVARTALLPSPFRGGASGGGESQIARSRSGLPPSPPLPHKGGGSLRLLRADLTCELEAALGEAPDLVSASAFFDLCSDAFIERFAEAVARRRAVFFTVLTYDGIQDWSPAHPADAAMRDAFHAHQVTDKGFGIAAGPAAPTRLREAFARRGYRLQEGDSPWRLGAADAALIQELARGFAAAVRETARMPDAVIDDWLAVARAGAVVGHTDTLALPPLPR